MTNDLSPVFLPVFVFDDIRVDPHFARILKSGSEVPIEPKAFDLLIFLIENRGRLLEKNELLDAVWKDVSVTENALTREIARLRKTLGDDPKAARYIQTVHTRGYRFIADVGVLHGAARNGGAANGHHSVIGKEEEGLAAVAAVEAARQLATQPQPDFSQAKLLRLPSRKALLLVVVLSLVCIAAFFVWRFYVANTVQIAPEILEITPITTTPGMALNPTFSPDGNTLAYSSDQSGSFELYAKPLAPGGREIQITFDGNLNLEPAWSPDGKSIAYHSDKRGGIWLISALGGTPRQLTEFGCHPAWSHDGTTIAFQSESFHDLIQPYASSATLWAVSSQGGEPRQISQAGNPVGGHLCPAWSPDGKRIAFLNANLTSYQIWSVEVGTEHSKQMTPNGSGDKADLVWDGDGKSIYFTMGMMLLKLRVDPATGSSVGKPVKVADLGATVFRNPTISADGKKIAYSAWAPKSNIWSVPLGPPAKLAQRASQSAVGAVGSPVPLTNETHSRNNLTAFSPDGRRIAFTSERRGVGYQLWLMDADGGNQTQLTADAQAALAPSWFPDGLRLAFQSIRQGHQTISSLALDTRKERVLSDATIIEIPRLSPNGARAAFTYTPGGFYNIGLMNTESGNPEQLTFERRFTGFPSWSPDGQWLAFQMKQGDDTQIMLMPSSGGTPTQLTFGRGDNWPYSWSPDGDKIAFAGSRNGVWNIWWVSREGRTMKRLTDNTKPGVVMRFPDWSPLGNQIVYEQCELAGNINVIYLK
ncbi:MAG: PD40 domain-containing protein [Acidobacteria bacterium]|nr:PD40 domain-containing protein [Acidobacteriota bacterium]